MEYVRWCDLQVFCFLFIILLYCLVVMSFLSNKLKMVVQFEGLRFNAHIWKHWI